MTELGVLAHSRDYASSWTFKEPSVDLQQGRRFIYFPKLPYWLWGTASLLFNEYQELFAGVKRETGR